MAVVTSLRIGEMDIQVDDAEGATLKEILEELGIQQQGTQFIINGRTAEPTTNLNYRVRNNDRVDIIDNPKAGR